MRTLFKLLIWLAVLAAGLAGGAWWWLQQPLQLSAPKLEVAVPNGASLRTAANRAVQGGVKLPADVLYAYFRLKGAEQTIKPGDYEITQGMTANDLLDKLVRGDRIVLTVTLVEGWTFKQVRAALARADNLRPDTEGMTGEQIMKALGRPGVSPEGRFFPDTYNYAKNSGDLAVLRQSMQLMDRRLQAAWDARAPNLPLKNADEALTLASIVEKETGQAKDRPEIAGVFINRLRIGMRLQTDPTVIYGLGDSFAGDLKRSHLTADTPFNTYTRAGLPPTPISMPGKASLIAAVQPAPTKALYFVARGDGSSHFSPSLDEHNRAVNRYQRGGGAGAAAPAAGVAAGGN
ncbi:endolytic transglycosylase MltG [Ottowia oryzae]|uniref:Endolytic murein transglycosylase n=1 Tax=Ottowia oryzae TaxID=2109914 RepID=A0A2S0MFY5_9BURK|nr:endolytic transglycosylase MltG [Ottowia oryzae]AVO34809.1 endolytic transglycosylase MltG [Ottowia oryzae]